MPGKDKPRFEEIGLRSDARKANGFGFRVEEFESDPFHLHNHVVQSKCIQPYNIITVNSATPCITQFRHHVCARWRVEDVVGSTPCKMESTAPSATQASCTRQANGLSSCVCYH
eukprot:358796-Chlamydomonas_euryale.AAC.12